MNLLGYRRLLVQRLNILKSNLWFTFLHDTAYVANNWAGLASTTFYTISMMFFLNILYSNLKVFAGYSYQEMLFFLLVAQFTYYLNWTFTQKNIADFIIDVNKGNLDLVLTKPAPTLFFLFTRGISLLYLVREALPPTLAIVVFIKWKELSFAPSNLLIGLMIFIMGLWILHVIAFLSALPVFWLGESISIVELTMQMASGNGVMIPFEGYSRKLQITLGTIVPVLIATQFSASAILNKTNPFLLLAWATIISILAGILRKLLWSIAIKNYTSASS